MQVMSASELAEAYTKTVQDGFAEGAGGMRGGAWEDEGCRTSNVVVCSRAGECACAVPSSCRCVSSFSSSCVQVCQCVIV